MELIENRFAGVSEWWRRYNFVRPDYHSGDFEGNQIRHLLRSESLALLRTLIDKAPQHRSTQRRSKKPVIKLLFDALVAFGGVVDGCFSKVLRDNWQASITEFRRCLLLLPSSVFWRLPTKFHIVCCHVEHWCLLMDGGLACWHEQSLEAVHHDFITLWFNSYAVTDCTSKKFGDNLLRCVLSFNAMHTPISPPNDFESFGRQAQISSTDDRQIHEGPITVRV